jgi:hypothetical protein
MLAHQIFQLIASMTTVAPEFNAFHAAVIVKKSKKTNPDAMSG